VYGTRLRRSWRGFRPRDRCRWPADAGEVDRVLFPATKRFVIRAAVPPTLPARVLCPYIGASVLEMRMNAVAPAARVAARKVAEKTLGESR
jgi:hypothetical protein